MSYDGNGRCGGVECDGDTADTYREEMKAWAIGVNWGFGEFGNGGILIMYLIAGVAPIIATVFGRAP